jgi:prophage regulatory protein
MNILREPDVKTRTGLSRVQRWRMIRAGSFPAPIKLGKNSIGWREDDITAWLASRPIVNWAPKPETSETA